MHDNQSLSRGTARRVYAQDSARYQLSTRLNILDRRRNRGRNTIAAEIDLKQAVTLLLTALLGGLLLTGADEARAGCTCVCVDGLNRPLCSSVTERKPLCPPRVCPREPAVTRPLEQSRPAPRTRQTCSREKIYNRYSKRYEWWHLCSPR